MKYFTGSNVSVVTTESIPSITANTLSKNGNNDGLTVGIILAIMIFVIGVMVLIVATIYCLVHKFKKNPMFHRGFTNENAILCTSQPPEIPMDTYVNPTYGTN